MTEERVQRLKQRFMSAYDVTADGKLQIQEVKPHASAADIADFTQMNISLAT